MHVLFDTSPLRNGHSHRGIGLYTSMLAEELKKIPTITLSFSLAEARSKESKLDVVHYPSFDLFFPTLPLINPAPSIVTIHDVIPLEMKAQYPVGKKGQLAFLYQRLLLKKMSAVITDSLSSQRSIERQLSVPSSKISVVYLAANPKLKAQDSTVIKKVVTENALPKKYILYVGDINYNKNIPQLIKSLKYIDESIHLVLFGKNFKPQSIPEWQWIETQIALSDVQNRVHCLPTLIDPSDSAFSALYSGALAYVQPSLAEGFGLPVLEAMKCKTPVVSSNTTSLSEVGGQYAEYCEPHAESIAASVTKVAQMKPSERQVRIEKAYIWARTFTWKKTAEETVRIYTSITNV